MNTVYHSYGILFIAENSHNC